MENTKMLAKILLVLSALSGWAILHTAFWHWVLPGSLWGFAGSMMTSAVIPAFAISVWADCHD